jgi:hypothetical protein
MQQQNTMRINKIKNPQKTPTPKLALDMGDDDETDDGVGEGIGMTRT